MCIRLFLDYATKICFFISKVKERLPPFQWLRRTIWPWQYWTEINLLLLSNAIQRGAIASGAKTLCTASLVTTFSQCHVFSALSVKVTSPLMPLWSSASAAALILGNLKQSGWVWWKSLSKDRQSSRSELLFSLKYKRLSCLTETFTVECFQTKRAGWGALLPVGKHLNSRSLYVNMSLLFVRQKGHSLSRHIIM